MIENLALLDYSCASGVIQIVQTIDGLINTRGFMLAQEINSEISGVIPDPDTSKLLNVLNQIMDINSYRLEHLMIKIITLSMLREAKYFIKQAYGLAKELNVILKRPLKKQNTLNGEDFIWAIDRMYASVDSYEKNI